VWSSIKTNQFLIRMFREYYLRKLSKNAIPPPDKIQNREFAFAFWDIKGLVRHIKLDKIMELKKFLKGNTFQHIYISGAYYQYPNGQSMNQKNWLGMDFLIDIDCDHFITPCKVDHDSWICRNCGNEGKGVPPLKCKCGNSSFDEFSWICDHCLGQSKKEVIKLIDYFLPSFDIQPEDISIHFSGNRGYHILIHSEEFKKFGQLERREFVDYLTGSGLNLKYHGRIDQGKYTPPKMNDRYGWGRYIYNKTVELLEKCDQGSLDGINITEKTKNDIIEKKQILLNELKSPNPLIKSISKNIWNKLIKFIIDNISLKLDVPVSIDLHRLIRFVNSLHGKTGFMVQDIALEELKDYDPFIGAIAFSDDIKIKVEIGKCPKFRIRDQIYGPFELNEKIELPLPAAIYVLCKKVGNYISK